MNRSEQIIKIRNYFTNYGLILERDECDNVLDFALSLLQEQKEEKEEKAVDFYLWMNANNYDHNIRQRVEKKYEIFKRNGVI